MFIRIIVLLIVKHPIMKKNKFYILLWIIASISARAQSLSPTIINSTGGTATINGIVYDYSFGEITLISTFATPKLIVTQGLLQTRTDTAAVGIHDNERIMPQVTVYPNPAQQLISFEAEYKNATKLHYELMDAAGKQVATKVLTLPAGKNRETLDVSMLPAGMYLLKITLKQGEDTFYQTSKIQKLE
jgi:hypothetical protein